MTTPLDVRIDPLLPPDMANKAEAIGCAKANMPALSTFLLAVLAGAFVALGCIFATTVGTGLADVPYGLSRLVTGLSFTLGLVLVVVGGAELFTGNNLIIMAAMSRKITIGRLLRNWAIVYLGNLAGSLATAALVFVSGQYKNANGLVGLNMLQIGELKTSLNFLEAVVLGILCNGLVCLAIWLTYSARSTTDKILAILLPITAFVAAGFEHSVANMYFIPAALLVKFGGNPVFFEQIGRLPEYYTHLTWANFLAANLLPVTIGNILGGSLLVGIIYWFIYLRRA